MSDVLQRKADALSMRMPAYVLLVMVMGFIGSYLSDRINGNIVNAEVALMLPLALLLFQPLTRFCDGLLERWFLLAAILGLWLIGVQWLRADALPAGWYRFSERAAALSLCLFVATRRIDTRSFIANLGRSAAVVATICMAVEWHFNLLQPMNTMCFGLGQINILTNTVGPSLLVWLVLLGADWCQGRRPRGSDLAMLALGIASLTVIAVTTERRGILLEVAAGGGWVILRWLWHRQRVLAWMVLVGTLTATLVLAWHLLSIEVPTLRNERIDLYRGALEGIRASWPWGFGQYGMLHLQWVDGEACRHLTACGGWGTHAHNEFLDICLDGGPVALLLMLILVGILVWRLAHIRDGAVRIAFQAMGAAILMHLLCDNVYGTTAGLVWLGVVTGKILAEAVCGISVRALGALPGIRHLAWPLCIIATWGATVDLYPCIIADGADAEIHVRCLRVAYDPQVIDFHALYILTSVKPPVNPNTCAFTIREAVRKRGYTGQLAVLETQRALAAGEDRLVVTDIQRVLDFSPFYRDYYALLNAQLQRHPDYARYLPPRLRHRLLYVTGDASLPPRLNEVPHTIDAAADLFAGIVWSIDHGSAWAPLNAPLEHLCRHYGDIPDVAALVIQAARSAPPGTFLWLGELAPTIEVAMRLGTPFQEIERVSDGQEAQALMPLIDYLYPGIIADCRAGKTHPGSSDAATRLTIERIWHLARAHHAGDRSM